VGPRFSGKVREEPQRREGKWGEATKPRLPQFANPGRARLELIFHCAQHSHPPTQGHGETCPCPGEGRQFAKPLFREWPRLPFTCAHRTSTVSSCAFCEQEGHLAAPSPSFITKHFSGVLHSLESGDLPEFPIPFALT